jgi:hypothetical protein
MDCKSIYFGQKHSKWAVIFALFLSLFTFSNNGSNSIISQSNPAYQTEWFYQKRKDFTAQVLFHKTRKAGICLKQYGWQILAFNKLLHLKLAKLAETFLSISTTTSFFVQEAISNYPVEINPAN